MAKVTDTFEVDVQSLTEEEQAELWTTWASFLDHTGWVEEDIAKAGAVFDKLRTAKRIYYATN